MNEGRDYSEVIYKLLGDKMEILDAKNEIKIDRTHLAGRERSNRFFTKS